MAVDRFPAAIGAVTVTEYFQKSSVHGQPTAQGFLYTIEIHNPRLVGLECKKVVERHAPS